MPSAEPRIVSLIASATEIVYELGLDRFLVGRSHECDYPPEVLKLPCCTSPRIDCAGTSREIDERIKVSLANALSVYDVFDDALLALQPTHIVTQTQCEVCAVSLKDVERSIATRLESRPQLISLQPNCLEDIWDDLRRVAGALDISGESAIARLKLRLSALRDLAYQDPIRPRVACIEWLEPLMAAGNWVPELLEMANAINLFGEAGKHSPWMTWADLLTADPDAILAVPCGFAVDRTLSEMHWLTDRREYRDLKAVRENRVYVADGNRYFNRPGPGVVESLRILVEILHPRQAPNTLQGDGWRRF